MRRKLSYPALPKLSLARGATSPNPGDAGALAFSTLLATVMEWDGAQWEVAGHGPMGSVDLAHDAAPAARVAGSDRLFTKQVATRRLLALQRGAITADPWTAEKGLGELLEPSSMTVKKRIYSASLGSSTPALFGFNNNASATSIQFNTNAHDISYLTAATAGSSASWRHGANMSIAGSWLIYFRFMTDGPILPERMFVGIANTTGAIGNVDPSSLSAGVFGLSKDLGDAKALIMSRDSLTGGAAIKSDHGLAWTASTWYEFLLSFEAPVSSGTPGQVAYVGWGLRRGLSGPWTNGVRGYGEQNALPYAFGPHVVVNNGATAAARRVTVSMIYMESDN